MKNYVKYAFQSSICLLSKNIDNLRPDTVDILSMFYLDIDGHSIILKLS